MQSTRLGSQTGKVTIQRRPSFPVARRDWAGAGFTLVELLVVTGIIAILAALLIAGIGRVVVAQKLSVHRAEFAQLELAIQRYKEATNFFPPDNLANQAVNPLYYELQGTTRDETTGTFRTLDGVDQIISSALPVVFGIDGFMNCQKRNIDPPAKNFLLHGKPAATGIVTVGGVTVKLLVSSVRRAADAPSPPVPSQPELNPWHYNSSNPRHNPNSFDLWIDVPIRGKIYRISNWRRKPEIL